MRQPWFFHPSSQARVCFAQTHLLCHLPNFLPKLVQFMGIQIIRERSLLQVTFIRPNSILTHKILQLKSFAVQLTLRILLTEIYGKTRSQKQKKSPKNVRK